MAEKTSSTGEGGPRGAHSRPPGTGPTVHTTEAKDVAIELLEPDPANVRKAFSQTELEELASTLKRDGILQPLLVRPHSEKAGHYLIIAGERRHRAAALAGLKAVPVVIRNTDRVRGLQLIENLHRSDLSPLEKADGIAAIMKEEGLDEKAVAARLGFSHDREIRRYLQLHRAPAFLREALCEGTMSEGRSGEAALGVARVLDYRTALEVLRIFNHYAKVDFTEGKKVATAQTKRILERALNEGWSKGDYENLAVSLGKPRRSAKRPPARALYRETPKSLTVDLRRVGETKGSGPEALDELISRLESLLSGLRESKSLRDSGAETDTADT